MRWTALPAQLATTCNVSIGKQGNAVEEGGVAWRSGRGGSQPDGSLVFFDFDSCGIGVRCLRDRGLPLGVLPRGLPRPCQMTIVTCVSAAETRIPEAGWPELIGLRSAGEERSGGVGATMPCSAAQTPIWVRETKPSLFKMCSMCAATVRSVITSDPRQARERGQHVHVPIVVVIRPQIHTLCEPRSCRRVVALVERQAAKVVQRPCDFDPVVYSPCELQALFVSRPRHRVVSDRVRDCPKAVERDRHAILIILLRASRGSPIVRRTSTACSILALAAALSPLKKSTKPADQTSWAQSADARDAPGSSSRVRNWARPSVR